MNYEKRIADLKKYMKKNEWDFLLLEEPHAILYYTNILPSIGQLIVHKDEHCLFVDSRYLERAKKSAFCPVDLLEEKKLKHFYLHRAKKENIVVIDSHRTSVAAYEKHDRFFNKLKEKFQIQAVTHPTQYLRMIKDKEEINILKKAALLNYQGFLYIQ